MLLTEEERLILTRVLERLLGSPSPPRRLSIREQREVRAKAADVEKKDRD